MRRTNPSGSVRRITYVHVQASRGYPPVVFAVTPILPSSKQRRSYRAPVGMPKGREDWRIGTAVSVVVHVACIVLLLLPLALADALTEIAQGAGGPGPAGGGGGGARGPELLRFVRVAAPPPTPTPQVKAVPAQTPPPPPPEFETQKLPAPTLIAGTAGAGLDNTTGAGPGSGGGVGTGIGTGRGTGVGPGTGGGTEANFPPTPTELFIPPLPVPESVKGFHLIAEFDVDETGRVVSMKFTETRDRGYNRRLADVLRAFRFRPGTKPDGTPIRMKAQVVLDLY